MKRRRLNKVTLIIAFSIALLFLGIAYSILKQELEITGKATITKQDQEVEDYIVTYEIKNKWFANGKYYYDITVHLKNNTKEMLEGWEILMNAPKNPELLSYYDVKGNLLQNKLQFTNVGYNAQVQSKETISFGFQIATTDPYYQPENIIVNGTLPEPPEKPDVPDNQKKVEITIQKENEWESGEFYFSQLQVILKNIGKTEITSWKFDLMFDNETSVEQIWNGNVEKKNETRYTFSPSLYNGLISIDGEASFGIIIKSSEQENKFQIIEMVLN